MIAHAPSRLGSPKPSTPRAPAATVWAPPKNMFLVSQTCDSGHSRSTGVDAFGVESTLDAQERVLDVDARRGDRLLDVHPEVDQVDEHLEQRGYGSGSTRPIPWQRGVRRAMQVLSAPSSTSCVPRAPTGAGRRG